MRATSFPLQRAVDVRFPLPNTAAGELVCIQEMLPKRSRYLASAGTAASDAKVVSQIFHI